MTSIVPIDCKTTLSNINNNTDLFNELLELLIHDIDDLIKETHTDNDDIIRLAKHLHKLKGICRYLSLPILDEAVHHAQNILHENHTTNERTHSIEKVHAALIQIQEYYHAEIVPST